MGLVLDLDAAAAADRRRRSHCPGRLRRVSGPADAGVARSPCSRRLRSARIRGPTRTRWRPSARGQVGDDEGRGRAVPRRFDANPQLTTAAVARELAQDKASPDSSPSCRRRFRLREPGLSAICRASSRPSPRASEKAPPVLLDAVPSSTTEVAPAAQAAGYASAIEAASCLPDVSGVLLDRLVDGGATSSRQPGSTTPAVSRSRRPPPSSRR